MNKPGNSSAVRGVHDSIVKVFSAIDNRKVRWWSPRGILLFLLPIPLIPTFVMVLARGDLAKSLIVFVALVLYLWAAILARRGLLLESSLELLEDTQLPPRKSVAAIAISIATLFCAWWVVGHGFLFSLLMSMLAYLAFYLSYGLDKLDFTHFNELFSYQKNNPFHNVVQNAEEKIASIERAGKKLDNKELRDRLARIIKLARSILIDIQKQPGEISRARRFLYVYLDGAQRVVEGYAKTHSQAMSGELDEKFRNVLVTIEGVFQEQQKRILRDDLLDLDVQIEVLSRQLKEEGM